MVQDGDDHVDHDDDHVEDDDDRFSVWDTEFCDAESLFRQRLVSRAELGCNVEQR
jgi:hypothetical protein